MENANIARINRGYYEMKNVKESPNTLLFGHLISIQNQSLNHIRE